MILTAIQFYFLQLINFLILRFHIIMGFNMYLFGFSDNESPMFKRYTGPNNLTERVDIMTLSNSNMRILGITREQLLTYNPLTQVSLTLTLLIANFIVTEERIQPFCLRGNATVEELQVSIFSNYHHRLNCNNNLSESRRLIRHIVMFLGMNRISININMMEMLLPLLRRTIADLAHTQRAVHRLSINHLNMLLGRQVYDDLYLETHVLLDSECYELTKTSTYSTAPAA
jgi:hypothetical protein